MQQRTLFAVLLILAPLQVFALVIGQAQTFQMPAWVERDGERLPLRLGQDILAGDKITTGERSRVLLNIRDGSDIKIGERAQFAFDQAEQGRVFKGSFRMLTGAFRYATNQARPQSPRDLNIRVGAITVGIRGTDVWGKSAEDADTVVLIEGDVQLSKADGSSTRLNQALKHVVTAKTLPLADPLPVVMDDLKAWAFETELQQGKGVVAQGGQYRLHVGAFSRAAEAERLQQRLANWGYDSQISVSDSGWHRVFIAHFTRLQDAQSIAQDLQLKTQRQDYWFSRVR